jgi:hypothetical protein
VKVDDEAQSKAFIEKAREIGAGKGSSAEAIMGQLARTPPQPHSPKAKKKRRSTPEGGRRCIKANVLDR